MLGNKSFSITLPKTWVERNNLKPRNDIEVIEIENKLIICPEVIQNEICAKVITIDNDFQKDEIVPAIVQSYRQGHLEIKIVLKCDNNAENEEIKKLIQKFYGITVIEENNVFIIKTTDKGKKCSEILNKCYYNLLQLSGFIIEDPRADGWEKHVFEIYERIYFLTAYLFRIVSIEGSADFKASIKYNLTAGIIQILAEVLKSVANLEHEIGLSEMFGGISKDLNKLVLATYEICMLHKDPELFHQIKNVIALKIKEKRYNMACIGYAHMCEYLCSKLVQMEYQ
jgi:ribosomal protein L23